METRRKNKHFHSARSPIMLCLAVRYNILKLFLKNWFTKWKAKQKNPRELKSKILFFHEKKKSLPLIFDLKLQKMRLRNREITVPGIQIFELLNEAEKQRSNSIQYSKFANFFSFSCVFSGNKQADHWILKKKISW